MDVCIVWGGLVGPQASIPGVGGVTMAVDSAGIENVKQLDTIY